MRRSLIILAVTVLSLVAATPASAGALTTQNSCQWSYDREWRFLNVDLTGTAAPNPVAAGSGTNLTQTAVHVRIPEYLIKYGHGFQILKAGENEIRAKAWIAIEGTGTTQGVVVHQLDTVARFTITEDAEGVYVSSTPVDVTIPIRDTAWTAGTSPLAFRQAGAGTLTGIPAGVGGGAINARGSAYIRMELGALAMTADCQPANGEGANAPEPFTAGAFETVGIDPSATAIPAPRAAPAVALRTTVLKAKGRSVKVALSCTAADCRGALTLKAGARALAAKQAYSIRSGARRTVTLKLTKSARKALDRKRSQKVTLRITATGGKTITKRLTLR